jgi:diguanylate cyclase (GGDEF)-like protein
VTFEIKATATKEPIGFIIWEPDLPGSRVIASLIPALATAALIIAALLAILIALLRRSLADLQDSEQKSRHRSMHDILTDLPNRALFDQRLKACLGGQSAEAAAVALIDLDRFKVVNDTLGHAAGDALIQMVAARISNFIGDGDVLARLGGDEFALLLPGGKNQNSPDYLRLCALIVEELSRPFALLDGKATAQIGCSIGVTRVSELLKTPREILHQADLALYEAKFLGRGRFVEYAPSMRTSAKLRETLKGDLRELLEGVDGTDNRSDHGIEVFYQTIHCAQDTSIVSGAEALVRWRHPEHGLLTPDRFISLAEESGLITGLGNLVLRKACHEAAQWREPKFVSVNVSPVQLRSHDFADMVLQVLEQSGLAPQRLELEITETTLMASDRDVIRTSLSRLRERGIKIGLDDFGTGSSSLSHLIDFPVDRLKIDCSFVRLLGTRADGTAVVSAIISLGNALGIATTAEGVETVGQRDFLVSLGCTDLQGFLFSRPQPVPNMGFAGALERAPKAEHKRG